MTSLLPNSYLTATDWPYWFGPASSPLLTLGTVDAYGCQWWADEPDGWAAPAAVTPIDGRGYGDGGYAGDTTFEARTLSFGSSTTNVTACPDRMTAMAARRRLVGILGSRVPVLYTQTDYPVPQSLWLRASGAPKVRFLDDRVFEWSAVMVAEDPFKFDAAQAGNPLSTGLPIATGGWRYNRRYPLIYGVGSSQSGTVTAVNEGDEYAQTVYTLSGGALDHPTVLNTATGAYFTINRVTGPLDTVTVDTANGLVLLNGATIYGDLIGGFPLLAPGDNPIQWSHRGLYSAAPVLTVVPASAWK